MLRSHGSIRPILPIKKFCYLFLHTLKKIEDLLTILTFYQNFFLKSLIFVKGLGLSGKVVTNGDIKQDGPSGIQLYLILDKQVIDQTESVLGGRCVFF